MNPFRRNRESGRANDNPDNAPSGDTGSTSFLRRLVTSLDRTMPLDKVEQAIDQGLRHNPQAYDSTRVRYKTLRDNVLKVIKGFCEERGQDLLRQRGVARETHIIPNTALFVRNATDNVPDIVNPGWQGDMTLNQMIGFLQYDIDSIRRARLDDHGATPYASLNSEIEYFESIARPFLIEMGNIYQRRYGHHPSSPPQYEAPPGYEGPSENQSGPSSRPS